MSEINPLGASTYYGGLQNATSQAAKDAKKEKTNQTNKTPFTKLLQANQEKSEQMALQAQGYPPQIAGMSVEEAAVYLKDAVDVAGNKLSESQSMENIIEFKNSVRLLIKYITENNYHEIKKSMPNKFSPPLQRFSKFNTQPHPKEPRLIIETINTKLDDMVRDTLNMQVNNLKILERANEIKGLIIDLMQG